MADILRFRPRPGAPLPAPDALASLAADALAANTRRAYDGDYRAWQAWIDAGRPAGDHGLALFLASLWASGLAAPTLLRRASGIAGALRARDLPQVAGPETAAALRGIRRRGQAAPRRARPLTAEMLRAAILAAAGTGAASRDRALLATGWTGALRRSELAALRRRDWQPILQAAELHIRTAKSGAGRVQIPAAEDPAVCPVRLVGDWIREAGLGADEPLFPRFAGRRPRRTALPLSGAAVQAILRRRLAAAGIDPDGISGHSLRAGMITAAAEAGAADRDIMRHSRHRSRAALDGYVRPARVAAHPATGLL